MTTRIIYLRNGKRLAEDGLELISESILISEAVVLAKGSLASVHAEWEALPAHDRSQSLVFELKGALIIPGMIDMHVHLREPGQEIKETVATGMAAAARGGYTTVACMANTSPTIDNPGPVQHVLEKAKEANRGRVLPVASVTYGLRGEKLTDFKALKAAGAVAFSDDGRGVQSEALMKEALEEATRLGMPVLAHAEDEACFCQGVVNAGIFANREKLPGISNESEFKHVRRDIRLVEEIQRELLLAPHYQS